jgi:hypothetical protein
MNSKKLYKHDCDTCIFLFNNENIDYYFCNSGEEPILLRRFSSADSDNSTIPMYLKDRVIKDPIIISAIDTKLSNLANAIKEL